MKKLFIILSAFSMMLLPGCGGLLKNLETSESVNAISLRIDGNEVIVENGKDAEISVEIGENSGTDAVIIPEGEEHTLCIYESDENGTKALVADYITLEHSGINWGFSKAPAYETNKKVFDREKNPSDYLGSSNEISPEDRGISALSREITKESGTDYEKVCAIHDWVSENIYRSSEKDLWADDTSKKVLLYKKGTAEGFANITAALVRSLEIPCRTEKGIAENGYGDAWNEAFVDNKWIILDTFSDSCNRYENGKYERSENRTKLFFDPTMEFFSLTHKYIQEK